MSGNEFGSRLVNQAGCGATDANEFVRTAMAHDKKRIRRLVILTLTFWCLDILLVPSFLLPLAAKYLEEGQSLAAAERNNTVTVQMVSESVRHVINATTIATSWTIGTMTLFALLAAISTIWLVLTVRRVTLQQVSLGLAQISAQLQQLKAT